MEAGEAMELEEEVLLIEIAQEADLIQAERIIDDYIDHGVGEDGRKNGDTEDDVREVEEMMLAVNLDKVDIQAEQSEEGFQVKFRDFSCGVMY